ncbi:DUF1275 domain-containing protein [Mucilaginibacter sp. HC2]|uniref:YoaK family protein n=1 Tax=Mucilaginibacter inviolabilis TaxID=2714892 RepID=UPI0014087FE3|nr:YoaK family protein [Mucilaginibacter inviolabilis]NHA02615.1 DUF1275 domain-containing protein [Mucilaginibacter inviolabilis]
MLRHLGKKRTFRHNVKLAILLSLTAGFINAAGFIAFGILTTNVTGHAALFAGKVAALQWASAQIIALWMLLFLLGAFCSSLIISAIGRDRRFAYVVPVMLEIVVLSTIGTLSNENASGVMVRDTCAGSLLFIMGMQNAMVSLASGAVVRTTHLTGTFTDLGIELADWCKGGELRKAAIPGIKLRLSIILCFLTGALGGAMFFRQIHFPAFYIPVLLLAGMLAYDILSIPVRRKLYRLNERLPDDRK